MTTRVWKHQVLDGLDADAPGVAAQQLRIENCGFEGCGLICRASPENRPIVRNIELRNCSTFGEGIIGPILDEVTIDGLKTNTLVICFATLCRHVTFKGRIGRIMFTPVFTPGGMALPINRAFAEDKRRFYESVDWAIDVREADPNELDLTDIPGRLVRRNPENSVRLLLDKLKDARWKRPGVLGTVCATGIDYMFTFGLEDMVIVAWPRQKRRYQGDLEAFKILKAEGIAEPD